MPPNRAKLIVKLQWITLVVAVAIASTSIPATAEPVSKQVIAEGRAAGVTDNAMEQAKQDALRRAVEQACGAFINAQTRTGNYAVVYDAMMTEALGYVEQYEVIEQRTADGYSVCKISADVSKASFEREWARLAHTIVAEGNPRCMVVVYERIDVDDTHHPNFYGIVQSILERFLLDRGLLLIDKMGIDDSREREIVHAALKDDVKKLSAVAASLQADVIIFGNAEARRAGTSEVAGVLLHMWTATINVRAYNVDTAQLLMSNSYSTTHASVRRESGNEALRRCIEQHAPSVLREIGDAWKKRQNVRRTVHIVLEDCSRAEFKAFESAMREVTGVQAVRLRELVSGTCHVEIDWAYDVERLVSRIEELQVEGTAYHVTEQSAGRVTLKIVK